MFAPLYKELDFKVKIVKRDDTYVPDLPDLPFGLVLVFCGNVNYYAYPLPASTEGKDALVHVVYKAEDDVIMQKFAGKLGSGSEVCKTLEYKSIITTTVADVKIAEEKAKLIAEADSIGAVVSIDDLNKVEYKEVDANDGYPVFVFLHKDYLDK